MTNLIDNLCARLSTSFDSRGRAHADCPFCGIPPGYHFYLFDMPSGRGYVCWSCGERGGMAALARHLDVTGAMPTTGARKPAQPRPLPLWEQYPDRWSLDAWQAGLDRTAAMRYAAWQAYKPLTQATIERAMLAVGPLPFWAEERKIGKRVKPAAHWYWGKQRLVVPLIQYGQIVGLRGRAYLPDDDGPKWLTATGSRTICYGLEQVRPGCNVIICENHVDALLAEQFEPGIVAIASTAGASTWRWTAELAARRPRSVLVWLDHDLAGNGSRYHHRELVAEWERKQCERRLARGVATSSNPQPPTPQGPRICNELLEAGIKARLYEWPRGSALHADLGSVLAAQMRRAA